MTGTAAASLFSGEAQGGQRRSPSRERKRPAKARPSGVAAGGSRKRAGRRAGASAPRRAAAWGVAERAGTQAQQTTNSPPRKPPHHSPSPNSAASVSRVPQAVSRPQAPYSVQIAARSINTSRRTVKRGGTGYSECSIK